MSASFIIDEASRVWLYYAKDIMIRDNFSRLKNIQVSDKFLRAQTIVKEAVYKDIEENQKYNLVSTERIQSIFKTMKNNFDHIKSKLYLNENNEENEKQMKIDNTFRALRPKSPFKLTEMLNPNFNPESSVEKMEFTNINDKFRLKKFVKNKNPKEVAFRIMNSNPNDPYKLMDDLPYQAQLMNIKNKNFYFTLIRNSKTRNLAKRSETVRSSKKTMIKQDHLDKSNNTINNPSLNRSQFYDKKWNKIKTRSKLMILTNRKPKTFGPQSILKHSNQDASVPNLETSVIFKL